jgi:hypothetical protein
MKRFYTKNLQETKYSAVYVKEDALSHRTKRAFAKPEST